MMACSMHFAGCRRGRGWPRPPARLLPLLVLRLWPRMLTALPRPLACAGSTPPAPASRTATRLCRTTRMRSQTSRCCCTAAGVCGVCVRGGGPPHALGCTARRRQRIVSYHKDAVAQLSLLLYRRRWAAVIADCTLCEKRGRLPLPARVVCPPLTQTVMNCSLVTDHITESNKELH